jgi:diguanylate cyclase (GGDEF)-like protein
MLRRLRPGLVLQFALASALPIVLLGFLLAHLIKGQIEEGTLAEARRAAVIMARVGFQSQLSPAALRRGLGPRQIEKLDDALASEEIGRQIARVKIWNKRLEIVYSDNRSVVGKRFPLSKALLRDAYNGDTGSEVSNLARRDNVSERKYRRLLEVWVPLQFKPGGPVEGVFDVYLPYTPIARSIERNTHAVYVLLVAGLGLLYAALFRIAVRASRRLRRQANELAAQAGALQQQAEELRRHAREKEHQALHDALTGLPNRTLFQDRIGQALLSARRDGSEAAVLLMDLDRFKEINDTLGHHAGDALLRELSERLRTKLRSSDTVARLGGDEFGILLARVASMTDLEDVIRRIREAVEEPFTLQDLPLGIEASIGVAFYPSHGGDVETLLQRADVAMYLAKESHSGYEIYDPNGDEYNPARLMLVGELRRAIEQKELVLHYQPKARVGSGEVTSVEALVRWQHPEQGLLFPDQFIPVAQHTGLIRPLTLYVLDTALAQCRAWQDEGLVLKVAVNLSMRNLIDLAFPESVAALLERWGVHPSLLELEITESTIMADPFRTMALLRKLKAMGLRLAIDDFGTGYSSLAYLKRLAVDEIKIDKSFVLNMARDENDAAIVRSTIDLARNLGLEVVAEGVESAEAWETLAQLGCDVAQGYYLSRPLPGDDLAAWLRASAARLGGQEQQGRGMAGASDAPPAAAQLG